MKSGEGEVPSDGLGQGGQGLEGVADEVGLAGIAGQEQIGLPGDIDVALKDQVNSGNGR